MVYREVPVPGIGVLWCSDQVGGTAVIPADGSADLILRDAELWVAGPSTRWLQTHRAELPRTIGLRFTPGFAGIGLRRPSAELQDLVLPAADAVDPELAVQGKRLLQSLQASFFDDPEGTLRSTPQAALTRFVGGGLSLEGSRCSRLLAGPRGAWLAEVRRAATCGEPFAALAHRLGYSERQLNRHMLEHFGYGFAALRRVIRAERARALLRRGAAPADAAHLCGFSDQAHLTRKFQRVVGTTPARFAAAEHPTRATATRTAR